MCSVCRLLPISTSSLLDIMSDVVPIDISPDRENHIKEFLQEYVMRVNKKRTKQLMAMSFSAFEAFKLSVRVSRCCRVSLIVSNELAFKRFCAGFRFGKSLSVLFGYEST